LKSIITIVVIAILSTPGLLSAQEDDRAKIYRLERRVEVLEKNLAALAKAVSGFQDIVYGEMGKKESPPARTPSNPKPKHVDLEEIPWWKEDEKSRTPPSKPKRKNYVDFDEIPWWRDGK